MPESAKVALVACERYEQGAVDEAVRRGFGLLGGARRFARSGERILLKPNLLVGSEPDKAVTTHPAVFEAVAKELKAAGATLSYGDSSAFGKAEPTARRSGLTAVAEALGVELADLSTGRLVSFPEGRLIKQFTVAEAVLDADGVISLPKLKTHALTRMTGAIKNQFGCVPGLLKSEWHARMPDSDRFSQMLVDLTRLIRPRLYVMDGIVGMEGNGPRNGDPRPVGAVLMSDDPVALDATACRIMALDPELVGPIVFGERWGLGNATDIELLGDPIEAFVADDFVVNRSPASTTGAARSGWLSGMLKNAIVPKPVIREERCTACGTCVKMCPVDPKAVDFDGPEPARGGRRTPPRHHYDRCIRCYCCQELCPERAIEVVTPPLGRIIHR
jgi:uncharacterized protein (DUF362 family)/ferredoxin